MFADNLIGSERIIDRGYSQANRRRQRQGVLNAMHWLSRQL